MKKITTALTLLIATYSFAQDCSQGRYKEEIFSTISTTSDIQYGSNDDLNGSSKDLFVDIYEGNGDTATNRALIIMAHGGSFIGGERTGPDVVTLCQDLAKKGYVVASMSYRLGISGGFFPDSVDATESVFRAVHDGRAAVRFFRKDFVENANSYGIDTSQIYFAGVSAGGFIGLHLAYLDEQSEIPAYVDTTGPGLSGGLEGTSGNAGYSSKVKAIVNLQGALGKKEWLTSGSVPLLSLHGNNDGVVPHDSSPLFLSGLIYIMDVDGSAAIAAQADAVGVNNCYKQFNGAGHTPHVGSAAYHDTSMVYITNFLAQFTCGDPFTCSDAALFLSISDLNINKAEFSVYPNPASEFITITSGLVNDYDIDILDLLGKKVYSSHLNNDREMIDVSAFKSGQYIIKLSDETGSVNQIVVIE